MCLALAGIVESKHKLMSKRNEALYYRFAGQVGLDGIIFYMVNWGGFCLKFVSIFRGRKAPKST